MVGNPSKAGQLRVPTPVRQTLAMGKAFPPHGWSNRNIIKKRKRRNPNTQKVYKRYTWLEREKCQENHKTKQIKII
jgi:hypothetical protein